MQLCNRTKDHHKNDKIPGDIKTILSIEALINTGMIISLLSLHLCLFLPLHHGIAFWYYWYTPQS